MNGLAENKNGLFRIVIYSSPQLVILGNEYDNIFSKSVNWFFLAFFIGLFRVAPSLCFKERLSVKLLIWNWFSILVQIKLISQDRFRT